MLVIGLQRRRAAAGLVGCAGSRTGASLCCSEPQSTPLWGTVLVVEECMAAVKEDEGTAGAEAAAADNGGDGPGRDGAGKTAG
jgi:hypothetical protein